MIIQQLSLLIKQNEKMATSLADVKQALTDLQSSVDTKQAEILAAIDDLKSQIGAGGTVTTADLDDLITTVKSIQGDVDTTDIDGSDTP